MQTRNEREKTSEKPVFFVVCIDCWAAQTILCMHTCTVVGTNSSPPDCNAFLMVPSVSGLARIPLQERKGTKLRCVYVHHRPN